MKGVRIPPLLFYWGGEVTRVLLFTPAAMGQRDEIVRLWRHQRARVLGILAGAYLGGRVLGEGQRRRRLFAAGAFAAGVIALALS